MASMLSDLDGDTLRLKTWPWWHSDFGDKLTQQGQRILEQCGVPAEQLRNHIFTVRDKAWDVFPFPCIGEFWFIEFGLSRHPYLDTVIDHMNGLCARQSRSTANLKDSPRSPTTTVIQDILLDKLAPRILDLGTCMGQDLRYLRHAGVPQRCLYGTDIFPAFEKIGFELFRDKSCFASRFFPADVFDDATDSPLNLTVGLWDVVSATMFTHQFDLAGQQIAAERMIRLLRLQKGSAIIGTSTGQVEPTNVPLRLPFCKEVGTQSLYRQSKETMRKLWLNALISCGKDLGKWHVFCEYDELEISKREQEQKDQGEVRFFQGNEQRRIFFWIQLIE